MRAGSGTKRALAGVADPAASNESDAGMPTPGILGAMNRNLLLKLQSLGNRFAGHLNLAETTFGGISVTTR
jgi:hypothetical protein